MVGHEHHRGRSGILRQPIQTVDEEFATGEVECGTRFVQQDQVRIGHERPGEQHPLTFARGQRSVGAGGGEPDTLCLEQSRGAIAIRLLVAVPPRFQRSELRAHDDLGAGELWSDHVHQSRAHERDATTQSAHIGRAQAFADHLDGAATRMLVQRGDADQRGLAAAVRSEHDPVRPAVDLPIDLVQQVSPVAGETDAAQAQDGWICGVHGWGSGPGRCVAHRPKRSSSAASIATFSSSSPTSAASA